MKQFDLAKKILARSQKILILLHQSPDGDTIASSLALSTYLKRVGKDVDLAVNDSIPEIFRFLTDEVEIKKDFLLGDYDLIVAIDCGDARRTGFPVRLEQIAKTKPLLNIDHHLKNNLHKISKVNLIDEKASAAAEIVFDLLKYLGAEIDSKIATYILAAIFYDTGGFQHANVTQKTLEIASACLSFGGHIEMVAKKISASKKTSGLKLWGIALSRMKLKKNGIVYTYLRSEDLKSVGAEVEEASGIVNLINSVPQSKIAILLIETPDGKIKASLRTESDDVDVSSLARIFGGGGHRKAAGFELSQSFEQLGL